MSWEEQFYLPQPVDAYSAEEVAGRVRSLLPERATVSTAAEPEVLSIRVRFDVALVDEVAAMLGSSPQKWLDYEWRGDLDPPRDEGQTYYDIVVEFVELENHELRVTSGDADNRAAWPLAFALAGRLAEEYGATEDPPPAAPALDDENFN